MLVSRFYCTITSHAEESDGQSYKLQTTPSCQLCLASGFLVHNNMPLVIPYLSGQILCFYVLPHCPDSLRCGAILHILNDIRGYHTIFIVWGCSGGISLIHSSCRCSMYTCRLWCPGLFPVHSMTVQGVTQLGAWMGAGGVPLDPDIGTSA